MGSVHERACQAFYRIVGGRIDYGAEHAERFHCDRFGDVVSAEDALFPDWSATNPVHLVGHSLGGQTARILLQLLHEGAFEDHPGTSASWVLSLVAISSPMSGALATYALGAGARLLGQWDRQRSCLPSRLPRRWADAGAPHVRWLSVGHCIGLAVHVLAWIESPLLSSLGLDLQLRHHRLSRVHRGCRGGLADVCSAALPGGPSRLYQTANCAPFDLTLHGAARANRRCCTLPEVVYGSVVGMGLGWKPAPSDATAGPAVSIPACEANDISSADSASTLSAGEGAEEEEADARPALAQPKPQHATSQAASSRNAHPRRVGARRWSDETVVSRAAVPVGPGAGGAKLCLAPLLAVWLWLTSALAAALAGSAALTRAMKPAILAGMTWATRQLKWADEDFELAVPGFRASAWLAGGHDGLAGEVTQTAPLEYDGTGKPHAARTAPGFPRPDNSVACGVWHTLRVGTDHLGVVPSPSDAALSAAVLGRVLDLQLAAEARRNTSHGLGCSHTHFPETALLRPE